MKLLLMTLCSTFWLCLPAIAQAAPGTLTLDAAIELAGSADPWLLGSRYRQQALAEEAVAVGSLPDPKVSLTAGNLPLDTFDINQEPMTQLMVGVSQAFPRGDTRVLAQRQKGELAAQEPWLREDRSAQVERKVTQLWYAAYLAQETIALIERNRSLFDYLLDAASASYSSALGSTRQQDLVRAQLELTRLEDRLTALHQQRDAAQRQLGEWIGASANSPLLALPANDVMQPAGALQGAAAASREQRYGWIASHPVLQAIDRRIAAMSTEVDLARQGYKPAWGVNAQYGYRGQDPVGRDRADLFSVGVTFDVPLFTGDLQDKQVGAAVARVEALRTDRQLLARRMLAELETALARLQRLDERSALYAERLMPQMANQADAALAAYNNDDGDFAEAVRARIAELDAQVESLGLSIARQQMLAEIDYLLVAAKPGFVNQSPSQVDNNADNNAGNIQ
ncbi:MAG: TolC family protein [Haliea sp.]|jgi:outer membrane protein TolC|nr:TolC family protein [Haliea sp.]